MAFFRALVVVMAAVVVAQALPMNEYDATALIDESQTATPPNGVSGISGDKATVAADETDVNEAQKVLEKAEEKSKEALAKDKEAEAKAEESKKDAKLTEQKAEDEEKDA